MFTTADFDDIRPYNDDEVRPTLQRLLADNEFLDAIAKLKMPALSRFAAPLMRGTIRRALEKETRSVNGVQDFQARIEPYLGRLLDRTTTELTVSGLERLKKDQSYLFISNHRDIVMDPAFVNWMLYQNDFQTLRIAIGDNLLSKPFASDLMRINKCFIVNRSATSPREKLKAARKLSSYIAHSLQQDGANIWIAQREGRAKDSLDKTNPAILSMIAISKAKEDAFGDYLQKLNIVPVSISYEWDACDEDKARELSVIEREGRYTKSQYEDVQSIAKGIMGFKGRVHLAFGDTLPSGLASPEDASRFLDNAILDQYVLQPSHCVAYQMIEKRVPALPVTDRGVLFEQFDSSAARRELEKRLNACDPQWRDWLLKIYANPVYAKLANAGSV